LLLISVLVQDFGIGIGNIGH